MALPHSGKSLGTLSLPSEKQQLSVKNNQGRFMSQLVGVLAM